MQWCWVAGGGRGGQQRAPIGHCRRRGVETGKTAEGAPSAILSTIKWLGHPREAAGGSIRRAAVSEPLQSDFQRPRPLSKCRSEHDADIAGILPPCRGAVWRLHRQAPCMRVWWPHQTADGLHRSAATLRPLRSAPPPAVARRCRLPQPAAAASHASQCPEDAASATPAPSRRATLALLPASAALLAAAAAAPPPAAAAAKAPRDSGDWSSPGLGTPVDPSQPK